MEDSLTEQLRIIVNTRDYENLKDRLGKDLGTKVYNIIKAAERADKELDICHEAFTELYENDFAYHTIKKALDKIKKL